MPKHLTTTLAVVAGCAIAAAATRAQQPSQTMVTATVRATPEKAGTVRRPVGVKLQGKVELTTPEGVARPILTGFEIWYGPGITFDGGRYPTCRRAALQHGGPSECPPKSFMGSGQILNESRELSDLGPGQNMTFINAPGGRMVAWIVIKNPVR
ncbi:MAG TPA: hypothetical protein VNT55_09060, partial [Baekduia sp.]|nr:hypothetical protein [Baekduia sp.]